MTLRILVWDGQHSYKEQYCGEVPSLDVTTLKHVDPQSHAVTISRGRIEAMTANAQGVSLYLSPGSRFTLRHEQQAGAA